MRHDDVQEILRSTVRTYINLVDRQERSRNFIDVVESHINCNDNFMDSSQRPRNLILHRQVVSMSYELYSTEVARLGHKQS